MPGAGARLTRPSISNNRSDLPDGMSESINKSSLDLQLQATVKWNGNLGSLYLDEHNNLVLDAVSPYMFMYLCCFDSLVGQGRLSSKPASVCGSMSFMGTAVLSYKLQPVLNLSIALDPIIL